jgi:hypothetical protein
VVPQLTEARRLRGEAERCFRLAHGIAEAKLADELEAIGQAFEREAELIERDGTRLQPAH